MRRYTFLHIGTLLETLLTMKEHSATTTTDILCKILNYKWFTCENEHEEKMISWLSATFVPLSFISSCCVVAVGVCLCVCVCVCVCVWVGLVAVLLTLQVALSSVPGGYLSRADPHINEVMVEVPQC